MRRELPSNQLRRLAGAAERTAFELRGRAWAVRGTVLNVREVKQMPFAERPN